MKLHPSCARANIIISNEICLPCSQRMYYHNWDTRTVQMKILFETGSHYIWKHLGKLQCWEEGKEGEKTRNTDRCNGAEAGLSLWIWEQPCLQRKFWTDRENQKHKHTETLFQEIKKERIKYLMRWLKTLFSKWALKKTLKCKNLWRPLAKFQEFHR